MAFRVTKQRKFWWTVSSLLTIGSILAMVISWFTIQAPLRPSLDFVGGTRIQIELACAKKNNCEKPLTTAEVQVILDEEGLGNSSVQVLDKYTLSVRTKTLVEEQRTKLLDTLNQKIGTFDPETSQIDTVGPTIGQELFRSGFLALLVSFFGIAAYLSFRFQRDYAFFAIVALLHDVLITLGVFAVLGLIAGVEVDSLFLVSLLTIVGFSVNDTVVIYDRVRENFVNTPELSVDEIVDNAVSQTLSRSINTTLTTLLPLVAIFLFGGSTLKYFALALIIGFVAGAYSSIFIASTLLAWWRGRSNRTTLNYS
ncbi:MAG: protein translocase subunit SecF [Microcystis sp. M04BS1]|uniref:Protein-export membrane protein SecF n=1 Tax=Microcystis aeruginosa Ma_MB_S_20031200_S102 TaxID=2486254 RepID=A0A552F2V6_MICAE|nr:protein translocase subunit SecF [Microcystis sp. M04BS1]TRU19401.1 MAG: protein translocase subunit SecF [Microcystis aeruginosa Ma_MB_S_20031200_S102D]TRU41027.1 MAG: protein translocase subunit SecF [Microcystis aeruginosa Ma_MB_S_20031200_S102]